MQNHERWERGRRCRRALTTLEDQFKKGNAAASAVARSASALSAFVVPVVLGFVVPVVRDSPQSRYGESSSALSSNAELARVARVAGGTSDRARSISIGLR